MSTAKPVFDVMVFSGGGFKGAYGAGAAKAIMTYYAFKKIDRQLCFVGNSAGALNAAVMAAASADDLIRFWLEVTEEDILGKKQASLLQLFYLYVRWAAAGKKGAFAIFPSEPRRRFIASRVSFDKLRERHLIVTATDFVHAEARAFYCSSLMQHFRDEDDKKEFHRRRLGHCNPIQSQTQFVDCLLASTAIPLAFPPVTLSYVRDGTRADGIFVDGGVGNNVPTREGAYFLRFLEDLGLGEAGDTYCIKLAPSRIVDDEVKKDPMAILLRTYDVYDYIHMETIVKSWHRINREIDYWWGEECRQKFDAETAAAVADADVRAKVARAADRLAPRQHRFELLEIEPSTTLGGTLDFSRKRIRDNIKMGFDNAMEALAKSKKISEDVKKKLINDFTLPRDV